MKSHTILMHFWNKPEEASADVWHQVKAWSSDHIEETTPAKEMDLLGLRSSIFEMSPLDILIGHEGIIEGRIL